MRFIAGASVLVLFALSAGAVPADQPREDEATTYAAQVDGPGASCMRKAFTEYNLVLTDSLNRADHYYLAATYHAMGEQFLEC